MKKVIPTLLIVLTLASCSSVLLTGRRQLNLVSDAELNQMSFAAYEELKDSVPLSADKTNSAMVKRVGTNIAGAVEKYMRENGLEEQIKSFQWEYNLFRVNQVNAFAMPGGKIAVYDGIIPKTLTEQGMAVVIGHEIAHVVARHSAERYSQQVAAQYGGAILGAVVGGSSAVVQNGVGLLYGIGGQMMLLRYSRDQEYEADELGLIFMAMAGYNPNEAITFWQRMTADNSPSTSDFMSTHPSDSKRIARLKEVAPKAMQYYKTGVTPKAK
jgi:predicted Zn-dependent protease